jgi:hypothetical protein
MSKIAIKIGNAYFYDNTLYGKTLFANKNIELYKSPLQKTKVGVIKRGEPIGVFQGYIAADSRKGYQFPSIAVGLTTRSLTFFRYDADAISANALKQQGTSDVNKEVIDVAKAKADADKPWYVKLTQNILPIAAITAIAIAYIRK